MSNEVVLFSNDQIDLLKKTIAKDATSDELQLFIAQCKRTGLDPFTRQIYFIKDKSGKVTVCSSIDGLRLIADRTGLYEGQTKAEWCGDDGVWRDVWLSATPPRAARVGVYKNKFREPLYATAIFDEYAGKYAYDDYKGKFKTGDLTYMWAKMPTLMIAKIAEALALRKAFPNDLSGIYSSDEAEVIQQPVREVKTEAPQEMVTVGVMPKDIETKQVSSIQNHAPINMTMQKDLIAKSQAKGLDSAAMKLMMQDLFNISSSKDLKVYQYEQLIGELK